MPRGNCWSTVGLTVKAQVAHVQDGSQQLGDLPVLRLGEHEHLHGRLDAGVVAQVVPAFALYAVPLSQTKARSGWRLL